MSDEYPVAKREDIKVGAVVAPRSPLQFGGKQGVVIRVKSGTFRVDSNGALVWINLKAVEDGKVFLLKPAPEHEHEKMVNSTQKAIIANERYLGVEPNDNPEAFFKKTRKAAERAVAEYLDALPKMPPVSAVTGKRLDEPEDNDEKRAWATVNGDGSYAVTEVLDDPGCDEPQPEKHFAVEGGRTFLVEQADVPGSRHKAKTFRPAQPDPYDETRSGRERAGPDGAGRGAGRRSSEDRTRRAVLTDNLTAVAQPVTARRETLRCGCGGEMKATGMTFPVYPVRHQHVCDKCGKHATLAHAYPRIVHVDKAGAS